MDYTLTKKEVERLLNRSSKTVSRYIKQGKLNPVKQKRGSYDVYLFDMEEVSRLKVGDIDGGQDRGQGTNRGTNGNTPTPDNTGRINNLHGETGETNRETFEGKKDTTGDIPEDIGDRTRDIDTLALLEKTIGILEKTLDNQSKVLENQSRQIDNLTNTQQFLINENSGFRKMLGLPTAREDIINGTQDGEVVDTGDKTQETQGTKNKGQSKDKPVNKAKQSRGHRGQNGKSKPKSKPLTSDKPEVKVEPKKNKKKFSLFSWIKG